MPYKANWMKLENGVMALVIPRVLFCGIVNKDERPDFRLPGNMDAAWWQQAIETARLRKGKGKREAYLLKRHNGFIEADHIGYLDNITFENPHAYCDVIVTNPEEIKAVLRGERANMSAETDYERHFVWGLSLIQGQEGHFSEEIPELRVEGVSLEDPQAKGLGAAAAHALSREPELVALAAAVNDPRRVNMLFSNEQQTELQKLIGDGTKSVLASDDFKQTLNTSVAEAVKTALAAQPKQEPKAPESPKTGGDESAEVKLRKRAEQAEARIAELEGERELDAMVREYRAANGVLTDEQCRKALTALSTSEARKVKLAAMKTAKLSTDDPAGQPDPVQGDGKKRLTAEEFLRAEFKAKKINHCTEDEYVRLNKEFVNPEELN